MNRLIAKLVNGATRLAFWRTPAGPRLEPPAANASTEQPTDAEEELTASTDASEPPLERVERQRVLAVLSSKRGWIPGAVALLGPVGAAMALTPPQAMQAQEHLQAERPATQEKKREQTGAAKEKVAVADAPALVPAAVPALARGDSDSRPGLDNADCQVSDRASVTRNLKNCIDSFNRSRPGRADRAPRKPAATGPAKSSN